MPHLGYKRTFFVRTFAYFLIFTGLMGIIFQFGPLGLAEFSYRKDKLLGVKRTAATTEDIQNLIQQQEETTFSGQGSQGFGTVKQSENIIKPISPEYGIVIEKINANAKIIPDVDPTKEKAYTEALQQGVAASLGSTRPGENGNLFVFSHSASASWAVSRLNAVFYLLRELEKGDTIILYYQNRRYDYIVFDKTITSSQDLSFISSRYDKPVLTLQTCDPPGTLLNRLIIRAQMKES